MDIFKICIIAIVSLIFILMIKPQMAHISTMIAIISGIIIFLAIIPTLQEVLSSLLDIIKILEIDTEHIGVILKIIGISYICEFCSQICIDAGESALASKIDLSGKILIMFISIPVVTELLGLITRLMP